MTSVKNKIEVLRTLLLNTVLFTLTWGQASNLERSVKVRVVGGLNDREGIVLITYNGREGKLCDDGFGELDAAVICRMMGFTGEARPVTNEQEVFTAGATNLTDYILADLDCDGSEPTIADCQKGFWENTECSGKEDEAGVICLGERVTTTTSSPRPTSTTTLPPQICEPGELPSEDVRLVGGNGVEGRVEVKRPDGTWGSVCDDFWGQADAQVVCRMLCYNPALSQAHIGTEVYGNSTLDVYLDDVKCRGNESSIMDCEASFGTHDCDLTEPASVSCLGNVPAPKPAPKPELECSNSRITAKFSQDEEPNLTEEYVSLVQGVDDNCGYTKSTDANFISISIPFAGCNTNKEKTNSTHITYTNIIRHAVPPDPDSVISRATVFNIEVSCIMPRDPDPELSLEPEDPIALPIDGTGDFQVIMNLYSDQTFRTIVQPFPAKVTVGDWVYVGISLQSADPNLKLVVPECWATPTSDPEANPQHYFIEQKCRVESSVFFYSMNETMFAFRFQSFKFLSDEETFVYIHCKSFICDQSEKNEDCDRTCNTRQKRSLTEHISPSSKDKQRYTRSVNKKLYETDRGPLVIVDDVKNIEQQRNQPLSLPEEIIEPSSSGSNTHVATVLTFTLTFTYLVSKLCL